MNSVVLLFAVEDSRRCGLPSTAMSNKERSAPSKSREFANATKEANLGPRKRKRTDVSADAETSSDSDVEDLLPGVSVVLKDAPVHPLLANVRSNKKQKSAASSQSSSSSSSAAQSSTPNPIWSCVRFLEKTPNKVVCMLEGTSM